MKRFVKAQSTLQYGVLIAVVVGASLWMQNYLKRGMQGHMNTVANQLGTSYQANDTQMLEDFKARNFSIMVETAGINNPTTITITHGQQESFKDRKLKLVDN